jgi:signal transduction histidine kinase/ActR/RegA family two-component response regulator
MTTSTFAAALPTTLAEAHALILAQQAQLAAQVSQVRIPMQNPNPVFRVEVVGGLTYKNASGARLLEEVGLEEATQQWPQLREWLQQALATGTELRHEITLKQRQFSLYAVPEPDSQSVTLYLTEITERVRAEAQRATQQAFTEQVLDMLPSLVYVRDAAGRHVFANRATRQQEEQRHGAANSAEVAASQAQQRAASVAADAQVLATDQEHVQEEPLTLPTGEERCLLTVRRPLAWQGSARHVLAISTDVTELKQSRQAAEAAAQARANFLANMSHEIRTPLNGVLGIAAQLSKTPLDERQQKWLQLVQESGRHLLGILNDVLDLAKITSGKLELSPEPFNLCDSMFNAALPLALQAQEKGIVVDGTRLRDSCPHPHVIGDAHRLNQILLNLLSNAVKFTPAGGRITVGGYQMAETENSLTVEFRVRDTGVGIAAEKLAHIFDDFTQAYADTSRHFGGTGLGLSISRALVEQMGGTLTVESEVGQGSTFAFRLTLPRDTRPALSAPEVAAPSYHALSGQRVLLVEDNEINRLVARLLLEEWGMHIEEAEDGPSGVALATVQDFDIILMDIQMPGMSGLTATAAIRGLADPRRAGVPIVALTANAFAADAQQYLAGGMNACVAKPFEEDTLYSTLTELLLAPTAGR